MVHPTTVNGGLPTMSGVLNLDPGVGTFCARGALQWTVSVVEGMADLDACGTYVTVTATPPVAVGARHQSRIESWGGWALQMAQATLAGAAEVQLANANGAPLPNPRIVEWPTDELTVVLGVRADAPGLAIKKARPVTATVTSMVKV